MLLVVPFVIMAVVFFRGRSEVSREPLRPLPRGAQADHALAHLSGRVDHRFTIFTAATVSGGFRGRGARLGQASTVDFRWAQAESRLARGSSRPSSPSEMVSNLGPSRPRREAGTPLRSLGYRGEPRPEHRRIGRWRWAGPWGLGSARELSVLHRRRLSSR